MLSENPAFFYTLLDDEYFESIERYRSASEYREIGEALCGGEWSVTPGGFWTQFVPPDYTFLPYGWKIHVSATVANGPETLRRIVPLLVQQRVAFKFCADPAMHDLGLNKNWPRAGAGKFMTIYPQSEAEFRNLIEQCAAAMEGLRGPYILSDRPFPGSATVFYRYGEHRPNRRITASGMPESILVGPDGQIASDARQAYFRLPPWVTDPFEDKLDVVAPGPDGIVLKGRYRITTAERYSAIGGIYGGRDEATGEDIIIREVRPLLGSNTYDPIKILHKEARILQRLASTHLVPRFIDKFQEWEHWFVVQERLNAESLWGYAINFTKMQSAYDVQTSGDLFDAIRKTIQKLVIALGTVHAHQVVLRDLTKSNVMFTRDTDEVRFIDLELAFELDRDDAPIAGWTVGYASEGQLRNERPTPADDHYALGALIHDMLVFTASGLPANRSGVLAGLSLILSDLGLPLVLRDVVEGLTAPDPTRRWSLERVLEALEPARVIRPNRPLDRLDAIVPDRPAPTSDAKLAIQETIDGLVRFTDSVMTLDRDDRLWPAAADVFATNPVSVQFGAAGTLYFLARATGQVPKAPLDWLLAHLDTRLVPPGLHIGRTGVAMVLDELGVGDAGRQWLDAAPQPELAREAAGMYFGAAGYGLGNLYQWKRTGDDKYLARARDMGEFLAQTAHSEDAGSYWNLDGLIHFGYGHGGSGVAVFLDYLYAATGDERYLTLASRALDYEIANHERIERRVIWFSFKGARVSSPKSPHMRHGTAGVGTALIRHYVLTGEQRYRDFVEVCAYTVADRFTNKLWFDYGLAGYGEFLLDMYQFTGDARYLNSCFYLAEAILPHRMPKNGGFAFLGGDMLRIGCDFGMGSAGIGLFLHRLLHPETPRFLLLDELLQEQLAVTPPRAVGGMTMPEHDIGTTAPALVG